MSNKINVKIIGQAMTGKSTIKKIIVDALRAHGFDTVMIEQENYDLFYDKAFQDARVEALREKGLEIDVEEIQLGREYNCDKQDIKRLYEGFNFVLHEGLNDKKVE